jgi:hypothetical protein
MKSSTIPSCIDMNSNSTSSPNLSNEEEMMNSTDPSIQMLSTKHQSDEKCIHDNIHREISPPPPALPFFTPPTHPPYDYDFELERGTELSPYPLAKSTAPVFMGYCYFCDCPKHSQNYCPLRYCNFCKSYGHSIRVCPKNSAHGNDNWRHDSRGTDYSHFKYWRKPTRRSSGTGTNHPRKNNNSLRYNYNREYNNHSVPFGSTWKHKKLDSSSVKDWRKEKPFFSSIPFYFSCEESDSCGVLLDLGSSVPFKTKYPQYN